MGSTGTGMWGAQSGWNVAQHTQTQAWGQPSPQPQQHQFGAFASNPLPQNTGSFTTQDIWGGGGGSAAPQKGGDLFSAPFSSTTAAPPVKKDDAFGDLWGSFK
jgi:stromal membrane-associated protein